jgi:hypothetical protein
MPSSSSSRGNSPTTKSARAKSKGKSDVSARSSAPPSSSAASGSPQTILPRVSAVGKSDKPAKQDLLDREFYVMAVAALILNPRTQAPLTIGIYGPWGSGKSSFLAQLAERLPKQHPVANFNPWRLSGGGEVWAGLVNEIAPIIDRHLGLIQRIRFLWSDDTTRSVSKFHTRLAAASKKVGNWLTLATASGGFLAAGALQNAKLPEMVNGVIAGDGWFGTASRAALGWVGTHDLGAVKWNVIVGVASGAILVAVVFWKLVHTLRRPFSTQFKANLSQFKDRSQELKDTTFKDFEALRKVIGDFTTNRAKYHKPYLVLLIDDLDRCAPDRVVGVLEAVNSFIAELPIITVFAIDTKFVCSAVAARHRFLFSPQDSNEAREQYGRLFLEKIIHIPFQLAPIRSYELYVEDLLTISDDADTGEKEKKKRREVVTMPTIAELLNDRPWYQEAILLPFAALLKASTFLNTLGSDVQQRWSLSLAMSVLFGIELTPAQQQWLSTQDYATQVAFNFQSSEFRGGLRMFNLMALRRIVERTRQEVLSTTIKIQESDRTILRSHMTNLRGNPRSIKRFVNTYLLAKGINTLAAMGQSDEVRLEDLAAWLVLLQNWPREGSFLCGQARAPGSESFFAENWHKERLTGDPTPEIVAFVDSNKERLDRLARSLRGLDIARCFSFFTTESPQTT